MVLYAAKLCYTFGWWVLWCFAQHHCVMPLVSRVCSALSSYALCKFDFDCSALCRIPVFILLVDGFCTHAIGYSLLVQEQYCLITTKLCCQMNTVLFKILLYLSCFKNVDLVNNGLGWLLGIWTEKINLMHFAQQRSVTLYYNLYFLFIIFW